MQSMEKSSKTDFGVVDLNYVKQGYAYVMWGASLFWIPFVSAVLGSLLLRRIFVGWTSKMDPLDMSIVWILTCFILGTAIHFFRLSKQIYMVDLSCYKPPQAWRIPFHHFIEHAILSGKFTEKSIEFQKRILERAAVSEQVAVPPHLHYLPPILTTDSARHEGELVMFECVEDLLKKTGIHASQIGILVVNCSVFNPIPSLSSMIVRRFGMRDDIKTFNLGGMGCSANLIAVDLAKDCLLASNKGAYAIVLSMENITQNWYFGNYEPMLVSNILFRMGCGAVLLTNRRAERHRAKYRLMHVVRTHKAGSGDMAYHAAFQEEDPTGTVGVCLSKHIMEIAAEALKTNMRDLGPLVLPYHVQALYLFSNFLSKILKTSGTKSWINRQYVPDFRRPFQHICIHSGGKAVIRAVEKGLNLSAAISEPSKMVLHRFGNTSSSSTWYQFQYLESKGRMKKGNKIWQICLGSGFKCNSGVWIVNRDIAPSGDNAWSDSIIDYPLQIPDFCPI
ncbi:hypothetical protein KI387_037105 [Taxus chinensis]|uniref:3-ketoacyl-CoA synthase n=1 Tax=Taxus chinensis TaxID=29808 RepID=A0AA38FTG0_TAXCH|nr:hypothetical protein KI387_037105 [Taxus chinensis]